MNLPPGSESDSDPGKDADDPGEVSTSRTTVDGRVLDAIFGEVLADVTRDERDDSGDTGFDSSWYQENRPPHHDR